MLFGLRACSGRVQNFMTSAKLPAELVHRCTEHLQHFMFSTSLTTDTKDLLRELSAPLRAEVALASRRQLVVDMLKKSGWFEGNSTSRPSDFFVKMLVQACAAAFTSYVFMSLSRSPTCISRHHCRFSSSVLAVWYRGWIQPSSPPAITS